MAKVVQSEVEAAALNVVVNLKPQLLKIGKAIEEHNATIKQAAVSSGRWDTVLGRSDDDTPAWELVDRYLETQSWADLQDLWQQAYVRHEEEISWDEDRRFFMISGRELQPCKGH